MEKRKTQSRRLEEIPNDVIVVICLFLTPKELCSLSLVSMTWDFSVISRNDIVWKKLYEKLSEFDFIISDSSFYQRDFDSYDDWKRKFLYLDHHRRVYKKIEDLKIPHMRYPQYPRDFSGGKKEHYYVHWNGGRPFRFEVTENMIEIFSRNEDAFEQADISNEVLEQPKYFSETFYKYEGWRKLFVGEGDTWYRERKEPEMHKGNTIIFETNRRGEWTGFRAGDSLFEFKLNEDVKTIFFYVSLISGSDVPYPYFISEKYSCMMFSNMELVENEKILFINEDEKKETKHGFPSFKPYWIDRVNYFYENNKKLWHDGKKIETEIVT